MICHGFNISESYHRLASPLLYAGIFLPHEAVSSTHAAICESSTTAPCLARFLNSQTVTHIH